MEGKSRQHECIIRRTQVARNGNAKSLGEKRIAKLHVYGTAASDAIRRVVFRENVDSGF